MKGLKMARRCSLCGLPGHNKATCGNNLDNRYQRTGGGTYHKKPRKPVSCGCCGLPGHTKRTCPEKFYDMNGREIEPGQLVEFNSWVALVTRVWRQDYKPMGISEMRMEYLVVDNLLLHRPVERSAKHIEDLREAIGQRKELPFQNNYLIKGLATDGEVAEIYNRFQTNEI